MASLDTNVLVRFIVRDDEAQFAAARRLIREHVAAGEPIFVPVTVVLELEWVLRSRYGFDKNVVVETMSTLFSSAELSFESERALEVALQMVREASADFADAMHLALAAQSQALPWYTFDLKAAKLTGAQRISR